MRNWENAWETKKAKINAKFIVGFFFSLILFSFASFIAATAAMATKEEEEEDDEAKRTSDDSNARQWETGVK